MPVVDQEKPEDFGPMYERAVTWPSMRQTASVPSIAQLVERRTVEQWVSLGAVMVNVEALRAGETYETKNEKTDKQREIHEFDITRLEEELSARWSFEEEEDEFEAARSHWIQLQKTNKQAIAVRSAFFYLLEKYPHMRPIWNFARNIDDCEDMWKGELEDNFYFRHHCASIQAAITMIMENKDEPSNLRKFLNEIGGHHFFYDASEPHLEVFHESMIEGMKLVLNGADALDDAIEESWNELLKVIKLHICEGITIQRVNYLTNCMTTAEITEIKETWDKVREHGFESAGEMFCRTAFSKYTELLQKHNLTRKMPNYARIDSRKFKNFSHQIIQAVDKTIASYTKEDGFCGLIEEIQDFVVRFLVVDVCPPLIRKAFMEGEYQINIW
ncbi:unnamed protein product [Caenorhabditis auriculariae]|uniref:Globin domain-containing protein n=1 Tax=Caenorhabditis auriculariae TaxID=2777116 RepID=A0A8S1HDD7_9PELO|nr:unnamed protein product [Caenorhabditis auriculariae]